MANPLTEAVIGSITSQLDPSNKAVRELMSAMTEEKRQDVVERQGETIENIARKLSKAIDDHASQSVIGAYEKLLAKAQSV